ncbi:MAG TPA: D-alanyl-D-alanine carboxypeptidase family protein [Rhodospirillales bacterium]|nr:D-alanyl-D-alanine carboxypeptidase family protein [Rhodospirillales bacterium]
MSFLEQFKIDRRRPAPRRRGMVITAGILLLSAAVLFSGRPVWALETIARQAFLMDISTGTVLFEKNADQTMVPASMSKMMTVYMVFERLRDSSLSLSDTFAVSVTAWRKGGSRSGSSTMFLEPGERVKVEDLLLGIIVQSGNDASIAVAEGLAGGEAAFAEEMTRRGRQIGLGNSVFKNATGWPHPEHLTTSRDLAILARRTIEDFPEYYHYYAEREFTHNGIRQSNRNPLLFRNIGVDGLKTGHTESSGYGLVAAAKRGERRLILVVNGLPTKRARARESQRFFEWGFREFGNYALFKAGETVGEAEIWLGQEATVPLVIKNDLVVTLSRKMRRGMKVKVKYRGPLAAPLNEGAVVAELVVEAPGAVAMRLPLVAGAEVKRLGLIGRLGAALNYILWGESG